MSDIDFRQIIYGLLNLEVAYGTHQGHWTTRRVAIITAFLVGSDGKLPDEFLGYAAMA
jgi:hypothetical protein